MGAIASEEVVNWEKLQDLGNKKEEKILVLVWLRPLNEKEIAQGEVADWECINPTTILYRNSLQERSGLPTAYSFDRVFRGDSTTREVYEEGTKDIALSVVGGINSTIFAYGQTSSGKTYTMSGITEYAVTDIYDYIQRHEERAFALKFSAIEIYNEVVRDLLGTDNTPLRMLDDPERGTVIEKLTEETLRDWNHLKELLSICEAQRQVGETSLNETSSRSHQILRLTVESSAREFLGKGNSTTLAASVNFVDLAGSERASQALSAGQRLKEGCHINRSLLTLGTVIRKLSKGRNGHINYRDSKLTRILQPALGGNARTAIICTLCPARSHLEQSRNTLLFACCAKEVSTNAQVNVVMSDKALLKHLQKEVARLESELKTPASMCDHAPLLRKKDMQIEKLEKEVKELKKQCDFAHSRIEELTGAFDSNNCSERSNGNPSVNGDLKFNWASKLMTSRNSEDVYSSDGTSDPTQRMENVNDICKEVRCIENDEPGKGRPHKSSYTSTGDEDEEQMSQALLEDGNGQILEASAAENDKSRDVLQNVQQTIYSPEDPSMPLSGVPNSPTGSGNLKLLRSPGCRANSTTDSEMDEQTATTPPSVLGRRPEGGGFIRKNWQLPLMMYGANSERMARADSQCSESDSGSLLDEMKNQKGVDGDEEIPTLGSFIAGLRQMANLENQVRETEKDDMDPKHDWPLKFEKLQKSIIELWHACNVSLVHRTYFILLIKDNISDSIYMEVEHRRLSFLRDVFSKGNSTVQDGCTLTLASSKKALLREEAALSRLISKRYTRDERNTLYNKWGINLNSKRRKLQLVHLLFSDTENLRHVAQSAAVVAKLIGFAEHGQALQEMLGLSFTPPRSRRSFSWKNSMSSFL